MKPTVFPSRAYRIFETPTGAIKHLRVKLYIQPKISMVRRSNLLYHHRSRGTDARGHVQEETPFPPAAWCSPLLFTMARCPEGGYKILH